MKVLILLLAGLLFAGSALGQGTVVFNNLASPAYKIYTNNGSGYGLMTGPNQYRIGLYVGPLGAEAGSLVLAGLTTNLANRALAGLFSGGNPFFLPSPFLEGETLAFQVRAWAFAGGLTFREALFNGVLFGISSLGFVTTGGGIVPGGPLFGTNPGQIGAFTIGLVPEPSTYALGLLGVALFGLFRRRRR